MLSTCPTLKKNMFNSELSILIFPYSLFVFISIHTKNIKINIIINTAKIDFIYEDFMEYCAYWNDKYYMSGFSDAIKLIVNGLKI